METDKDSRTFSRQADARVVIPRESARESVLLAPPTHSWWPCAGVVLFRIKSGVMQGGGGGDPLQNAARGRPHGAGRPLPVSIDNDGKRTGPSSSPPLQITPAAVCSAQGRPPAALF